MTALSAFWLPGAVQPWSHGCETMLAGQERYGRRRAFADLGSATLGRNLFPMLAEDAFDDGPVTARAGDLMLVADVRLDDRAGLAARLGLSPGDTATMADATLLCRGWERWGANLLADLEGDFAVIAYDRRADTLTLARDLNGERPLFWHVGRGLVAAASMPAGLLALPQVERAPDLGTIERLLGFLPEIPGRSFYQGIERVDPGQVVTITRNGVHARYFRRHAVRDLGIRRFDDYVDGYREQLDRATAARLRGTGSTVAAQLSGGWDSSAVLGTAARLLSGTATRLAAITSVPRSGATDQLHGRFADESGHAAAAAAMFSNVDHLFVQGSARSPIADLDRYLHLYGRPVFNMCNQVWLARIREVARDRGACVVLTGEMGNYTISSAPNTLLADYLRRGEWSDWLREARRTLQDGRARLRGVLASSFAPWLPRSLWRNLQGLAATQPGDAGLLIHPSLRARMAAEHAARADRMLRTNVTGNTILSMRTLDPGERRKGVLAGWNIEERDPTADVRLADFMLSLPPDLYLRDGERRPLARAALADRVPAVILDERRKGYQASDWHEGLTADLPNVRALIDRIAANADAAGLIDVPALRRMVEHWPQDGWNRPDIVARYRRALLFTLSAGHFLVNT